MRDIVILAVTAAFFGLCVAYVRWCDHIIGPDPDLTDGESETVASLVVADDDPLEAARP